MANPADRALLCLCLTSPTLQGNLSILEAHGKYADIVELRVDCLTGDERAHAGRLPSLTALPAILTVRRAADGGLFDEGEADRIGLLRRLVGAGFAYVDLEEDLRAPDLEGAGAPRTRAPRVIRSLHDPVGIPEDLEGRLRALARTPREIPKVAVTPRSSAELSRLLEAAEGVFSARPEKIILGLGEAGFCTRVLAARIGSKLGYALAAEISAAPDRADPRTLAEMYRFHSVSPGTPVYGVIGNPISHSLSPLIHNRGLAALGLDAVYVPFLVDEPAAFMPAAARLGVKGLSVTIPHKQAVIPLLARRDALVEAAGACNTMLRDDGWSGTNTDVEGFLSPLREAFSGRIASPLHAVVLGAGGAARGVMAALCSVGARVLVLNRGVEKAMSLASEYGAQWGPLDETGAARAQGADLIVNATSVGMGDDGTNAEPLPWCRFSGRETVYDLAYGSRETAMLRRARAAGCRTISGLRMLLAQAFLQFRIFTGREYPPVLRGELEREADAGGLSRP